MGYECITFLTPRSCGSTCLLEAVVECSRTRREHDPRSERKTGITNQSIFHLGSLFTTDLCSLSLKPSWAVDRKRKWAILHGTATSSDRTSSVFSYAVISWSPSTRLIKWTWPHGSAFAGRTDSDRIDSSLQQTPRYEGWVRDTNKGRMRKRDRYWL